MIANLSERSRPAWEGWIVRTLDVLASGLALVLLAPIFAVIAVIIRRTSSGPAVFRQERVGQDRRSFTFYKFRTMRQGGSDDALRDLIARELRGEDTSVEGSFKLARDPRITTIGAFLRKTSLDELPQLFNVFKGDMTLVGPRPCLTWEAEMFPPEYGVRFDVKPGLTGLWQVSGRSTMGTLEMLELDRQYVAERTLMGDLSILLRTVPSMVRGGGAR